MPADRDLTAEEDPFKITQERLDPASTSFDASTLKAHNPLLVSSINVDEPVVTRRELWAYYRTRVHPS